MVFGWNENLHSLRPPEHRLALWSISDLPYDVIMVEISTLFGYRDIEL